MARGKVLIVEDEFLVSLGISSLVEDLGFEVIGPASRLEDALELAERSDLTLGILDVNLSGTMSWPAARALRQHGVPFFFLSGYLESQPFRPKDLTNAPLCLKPADEVTLRTLIERLALEH